MSWAGKISATYKHGVLCVTIPLAETAQPRSIAIEVVNTGDPQLTATADPAVTTGT